MSPRTEPWPIFVVTLEGDEERRAPLLAALEKAGLSYRLLFGVDGRNGLPQKWLSKIDRTQARKNMNRDMTDGEFACALSHQLIYEAVINEGLPGAVVLEDDAVWLPVFDQFMQARAYEAADLLLMDHQSGWFRNEPAQQIMDSVDGYEPFIPPLLTTGYTVSAHGARYMFENSFPLSATADWPCDVLQIKTLAAYPRIIGNNNQTGGPSHLSVDRLGFENKRAKSLWRLLSLEYWRMKRLKRQAKRLY
ncbi:hypothetical protein ACMU_12410 [Actibacterium mucosum KCTC 23349]|uniref:Glycosyl transferase family 25 domain-containing protein n=1 Tax=Actibacterium mucosum KCTC 23349 TaxID=1454373 RepID=A0A037ZIN7_9RHOB|nr:glycosyltransferase family 25 protein [Actibacterium mucosum]KAJ55489.1 hypothetical protein ACMU_12410 [Actibacterium mucosum KCTC 23349]